MIRSAGRVESEIVPVAKITVTPRRDAGLGTIGSFEGVRTGEVFEIEGVPRGGGEGDTLGIGGDLIVAGFIVVVACQVRL